MQETEAQAAYIRATQPYRDMVADANARLAVRTELLDAVREELYVARMERDSARADRDFVRSAHSTMCRNFRAICVCAGVLILSLAAVAVIR